MQLYPHQFDQIVTPVRHAIADGFKRILVVSPTGSGKTICFVYIACGARAKNKRVWILVHRAELVEQTCRALTAWNCPHGVLAAGCDYDDSQLVQVVSVQTLASRLKKHWGASSPDVIIVDEAHHSTSATWQTVFNSFLKVHILGFTATPQRLDGKGLNGCFDKMILGPSVAWLIENKYLVRPIYYGVPPEQMPDLENIKKTGGDYSKSELALAMEAKPKLTGDVVAHYIQRASGVAFIGFAVNREHARNLAKAFVEAGIPCEVIHGELSPAERAGMVARMTYGELRGLWSVDLVAEGFDLPAVGCAILCRPTSSLGLHLQQLGRALRITPGKKNCIILDHVGNLRHGTVEMPREWSLEGVSKAKRAKELIEAIKQCHGCYGWFPIFTGPCPRCGHVDPVKNRVLKTVNGTLKELSASEIDGAIEALKKEREAFKLRCEQGQTKDPKQLQRMFIARGMTPQKAAFRAKMIVNARAKKAAITQPNEFLERRKAFLKNPL